ncbi:MAG TPA: hypothetical protein VK154_18305 [Chitinophagales bacterium]|nr:hypothetical protein [Chitinophagales bacterium]
MNFERKIASLLNGRRLLAGYILFALYLLWQYIAYRNQGWDFVSWHLHLAPYFFLLLLWFSVRGKKARTGNAMVAALSVIITLLVIELVLTIALRSPLYNKFKYDARNYYHTWPPNQVHQLISSEFGYERHANHLGFADKEWTLSKQGKKRIIALGDSFTEGDGAPPDSAFPALLQQMLNTSNDSVPWEVLNAGTCGSDPVFDFEKLNGLLMPYQPDIVVQVISARDFTSDIEKRGGFERFKPGKTIAYKPLPAWFYPAAVSNICQIVLGAIQYLGYPLAGDENALKIKETELEIIDRYTTMARHKNFKVVFVVLPYGPEVSAGSYKYDFATLKSSLPHQAQLIDLLPAYRRWLAENDKKVTDVYWAYDGHHNATGYHMMATCIASQLQFQ